MLANANLPTGGGQATAKPRLTSAERRAAIVKAAVELFARKGFRGTTTRELASAVGVTEPVLYQHFETKRDLYTAMIDTMVGDMSAKEQSRIELLLKCTDDRQFFREVGQIVLNWYVQETQHIRLLLFSALEGHELADLWQSKVNKHFHEFVESYIARRAREGGLRVPDPAVAARAFLCMVGHFCLHSVIFQQPLPELSQEQVLDQFVDIFMNGVRGV